MAIFGRDLKGGFEDEFEQQAYAAGRHGSAIDPQHMGQLVGNHLVTQFKNTQWSLAKIIPGALGAIYFGILGLSVAAAFGIDLGLFGGTLQPLIEARWILSGMAMGSIVFAPLIANSKGFTKWLFIGLAGVAFFGIAAMALGDPLISGFLHERLGGFIPSSTPEIDAALAAINAKVETAKSALESQTTVSQSMLNNGFAGDDRAAQEALGKAQQAYAAAAEEKARLLHQQAVGQHDSWGRLLPLFIGTVFFGTMLFGGNMLLASALASFGSFVWRSFRDSNLSSLDKNPEHARLVAAELVGKAKAAYTKGLHDQGVITGGATKKAEEEFSGDKVKQMIDIATESFRLATARRTKGWFGGGQPAPHPAS